MPGRMNVLVFWRDGIIGRISAQWRKNATGKNRVAQDRRSELIFYFLKFGEEKFTAVDFFAVAETQKIWLA